MKKLLVAAAALAVLFVGARVVVAHHLELRMFRTHKQGARAPKEPHESLQFTSGGRKLNAFYVPADGPALLIFHGNGESISGWSDALDLLHKSGVATMVFDYSGFGSSEGRPSLGNLHEDGLAAWRIFKSRVPAATRSCAYGLSLGTGVLLDVIAELQPPPDCVALSGAFPSLRDAAVMTHGAPRWAAALLPDAFDNVEHAALFKAPLLLEHGEKDELFPVESARRIAAAHPGAEVVVIPGMHHGDPVVHPSEAAWAPIVRFVKASSSR